MRRFLPAMAIAVIIFSLASCEQSRPATKIGQALDRAGSDTTRAIGNAAVATGSALDRAGDYVNRKLNPPADQ